MPKNHIRKKMLNYAHYHPELKGFRFDGVWLGMQSPTVFSEDCFLDLQWNLQRKPIPIFSPCDNQLKHVGLYSQQSTPSQTRDIKHGNCLST